MTSPRILVAGVGNIFLGDDAFGVEVVGLLAKRELPDAVRIVDFGIRGLDLTYALLDGYQTVILVDAVPRGGEPGQVYVIEPDVVCDSTPDPAAGPLIEMHRLDPAKVLQLVSAMGGSLGRLLVVGCEPTPLDDYDDIQPGLCEAVAVAVPIAADLVVQLISEALAAGTTTAAVEPAAPNGVKGESAF